MLTSCPSGPRPSIMGSDDIAAHLCAPPSRISDAFDLGSPLGCPALCWSTGDSLLHCVNCDSDEGSTVATMATEAQTDARSGRRDVGEQRSVVEQIRARPLADPEGDRARRRALERAAGATASREPMTEKVAPTAATSFAPSRCWATRSACRTAKHPQRLKMCDTAGAYAGRPTL